MIVGGVDKTWAAELVDMSAFSRDNKGFKFILSIIDVFSKYGWLVPLKDTKGLTVRDAFQIVFKERVPEKLWTDKGQGVLQQGSQAAADGARRRSLLH